MRNLRKIEKKKIEKQKKNGQSKNRTRTMSS